MLRFAVSTAVLLGCAIPAAAQGPVPTVPSVRTGIGGRAPNPTISPYLNLLRRDAGIGFNYYQRLLPQREFRSAYQQQFRSMQNLNQQVEEIGRPSSRELLGGLGTTGHGTTFMSYGGYFGSGTAGSGAARGGGGRGGSSARGGGGGRRR